MKQFQLIIGMLVLGLCLTGAASNALAVVPTIDGQLSFATEWDGPFFTTDTDANDIAIPDQYDLKSLKVLRADDSLATDGLYFRIDMYGVPTLDGGPQSLGEEAFTVIRIDFDGNGAVDLRVAFNNLGVGAATVYDGSINNQANAIGSGTGDVVEGTGGFFEIYLPETLFNGNVITHKTGFNVRFDDNGNNPDDFMPNEGFTTNVPEPASMMLMGMGLLGLAGFKKFKI